MASITKQHVGRYTYLYESESFWDAEKKRPDNRKTRIGKIDALTGEPLYIQEYLDRLAAQGESIDGLRLWDRSKEVRVSLDAPLVDEKATAQAVIESVRDFGVVYFLRELAEKIGLLSVLQAALPHNWEEIFCLVCYLVAFDKPLMYCEDWVSSNAGLSVGSMSSQRISELLAAWGFVERTRFYREWHKQIREREYIALDITSVSSYSEQITMCEWGYNRDGERLPQINLCLLFGEDSKLPVYQTVYSGSLRDVSTLQATLSEFALLTDDTDIMMIMDKGFFSAKNINMLLGDNIVGRRYRFLVSVPFTSKLAKELVASVRDTIDAIPHVILTHAAPLRGVHKRCTWGAATDLHAHVFFNPEKAMKEKNELFGYVSSLARQALVDPDNQKLATEYQRYLVIDNPQQPGSAVSVQIREDVVQKELETVGWFVLLSNDIADAQSAHDAYRMKDVVEKGFLQYKNNLELHRVRVHSDNRMQNKVFIAFLALILRSAIYETMRRKEMFKNMTCDQLLLTLAKLKSAMISGKAVLRPITKEQTLILSAFGIPLPDFSSLRPQPAKKRGRKPKASSSL